MNAKLSAACARVLAILLALSSGMAAEDPPPGAKASTADRLVEVLQVEQAATEAAVMAIQEMLRLEPAWKPHQDILADYVEEQVGWEKLQPVVAKMYADAFTEEELRELIRFYESPVGRKMISKSPALVMEMQNWVRKKMQEQAGLLELRMKNRELERALDESVFLNGKTGAAGSGGGSKP